MSQQITVHPLEGAGAPPGHDGSVDAARSRQDPERRDRFGPILGGSRAMRTVYDLIEKAARSSATVLIVGETGTGKELVAECLHALSDRSGGTLLALNCAAIAPSLMESELFGHERGSFTGAGRRHLGCFEHADGGTLFLDEVSEMPPALQAKLLRVIETSELRRVGGTETITTDVRIVAATNRQPSAAVEEGKLRADLFYRLNVFPIEIPPLRLREGDVRLLASAFLEELAGSEGRRMRFSSAALELMERHSWPGNVRELRNAVRRAALLSEEVVEPSALPPAVRGEATPTGPAFEVRVGASIADVEKRLILASLQHLDCSKRAIARRLGISEKTLYNRLKRYGARPAPQEA